MGSNIIEVRSADGGETLGFDIERGAVLRKDASGQWQTTGWQQGVAGNRDMGMSDVHVQAGLATYAAGYQLAPGIADDVAPVMLVDKQSDYYRTFDATNVFKPAMSDMAGELAQVPLFQLSLSKDLYSCKPRALRTQVSMEAIQNADKPLDPMQAAVRTLLEQLRLAREVDAAAKLTNATTFAGFTATITSGNKWNGGTTSDPVKDLQNGVELAYMPINKILMSRPVRNVYARNANVKQYVVSKKDGTMDIGNIQTILDLPPVITADMKALVGTLGVMNYIWGNDCLLAHVEPGPTMTGDTISVAKTFRLRNPSMPAGGAGGAPPSGGILVRTWFDNLIGAQGGMQIVVSVWEAVTVTGAASSYLLKSCNQP